MLKKEWCKPYVKELNILKTEFSFDNLLSNTAVAGVFLLGRGEHHEVIAIS
ncbi:hypothetical protein [Sporomusa malonica]|uniref:Uncharacterized protein n=1 Tax=Sporomusa malonica TaxID=112901 RepID=A0A1W2DLB9_9FIRM|nr:hypothetical protein [Sporomusa malonica]SMC98239.1 hypothetical protein SAMN04488500_116119 [Sporomusa malonica]